MSAKAATVSADAETTLALACRALIRALSGSASTPARGIRVLEEPLVADIKRGLR